MAAQEKINLVLAVANLDGLPGGDEPLSRADQQRVLDTHQWLSHRYPDSANVMLSEAIRQATTNGRTQTDQQGKN
ncbi:MAG TPA: hypothetical protein VNE40_03005 [Candidatus Dormibacteraeota bacterium]|nr:hypothetical protein [Candidatus Dormibacteraeota bacterium]